MKQKGNFRKRRGAAVLIMVILGTIMFLFFAAAIQTHLYLHRQNQRTQKKLQARAQELRIKRSGEVGK